MNTTEELFGRSGISLGNQECGRMDPSCWPRDSLYLQKLAPTLPTSGSRSFGIIHSWTEATEFSLVFYFYVEVIAMFWDETLALWICATLGLVGTVRQKRCVELSQQQLVAVLDVRDTTQIITVQAIGSWNSPPHFPCAKESSTSVSRVGNFWVTKLKINYSYIWGYTNKKDWIPQA
jgi:hypothetical protein